MIKSYLISLIIPLNLSLFLLILGLVFGLFKRFKTMLGLWVTAVLWSLIWSLPITSMYTAHFLENKYPLQPLATLPTADAIVVLGGNTGSNRRNWFIQDDDNEHSRIDTAKILLDAHKAPLIILSGGTTVGTVSEAKGMAYQLRKQGVDPQALLLEEHSTTTHENAVYSQELMKEEGLHHVIVVTSALHMPRAMGVFKSLGVDAYAAPNPPQVVRPPNDPDFHAFWPNLHTLQASRSIIKEYLGYFIYYLRGWV